MPAKLPTHRPAKAVPDARVKEQDRARHAGRYLPYRGKQWQSIRRAQLERFPLCAVCGVAANEVDHIERDTSKNVIGVDLASLCKSCHSYKTADDEFFARTGKHLPVKGCDIHGWPLDPHHHWNREKSLGRLDRNTDTQASRAQPRIGRS